MLFRSGKKYSLHYREDRRCLNSQWLPPGESLTATVDRRAFNRLRGPVREIQLSARTSGKKEGTVQLRLVQGTQVIADETLAVSALEAGLRWRLPARSWELSMQNIVLELKSSPDSPLLLWEGVIYDG